MAAIQVPPWSPSISPSSGSTTNTSVNVTVQWCDDGEIHGGTHLAWIVRPDNSVDNVTSNFSWTYGVPILDCPVGAEVSGTITLEPGDNEFHSQVDDDDDQTGSTSATYTLAVPQIEVTPDGTQRNRESNTSGHTETFWAKNTGGASGTFSFSETCSGNVGSCSNPDPSSAVIADGDSVDVEVDYSTATAGSGQVKLTATLNGTPSTNDDGYFTINVQDPPPSQTDPWITAFTPMADTFTVDTVQVTIEWCDDQSLNVVGDTTHTELINRQDGTTDDVTTAFVWDSAGVLSLVCDSPDDAAASEGSIILEPGRNALVASVNDSTGNLGKDSVIYFLKVDGVQVEPDGGLRARPENTTSLADTFQVTNTGNVRDTFALAAICGGQVTNCSLVGSSPIVLDSGVVQDVEVSYETSTAGSGTLKLAATDVSTSAVTDTGSVNVTVASSSGGALLPNPTPNFDRSTCLTVNLGGGAIAQCGDLVLTYALPPTSTRNRSRAPTLIFSSQTTRPFPLVAQNVTVPQGQSPPDSVKVVLKLGTNVRGSGAWPGSEWTSESTRRVVVADGDWGTTDPSTVADYVVEVSFKTGTSSTVVQTDTVPLAVVNRFDSPYGRGWWLAGLEELVAVGSSFLWIGGDGSTRLYEPTGTTDVWATAPFARPDTLKKIGSAYARELRGGATVEFDLNGRHVKTTNRLGHVTEFTYYGSSNRVKEIILDVAGSTAPEYTFNYSSSPWRLTSVVPPAISGQSRTVTIGHSNKNRIDEITNPDGTAIEFDEHMVTFFKYGELRDEIDTPTTLEWDMDLQKIAGARVHMTGSATTQDTTDIVTTYTNHDTESWAPSAVDPDSAVTTVNGPRTDVTDVTTFHIDYQFGAPRAITDALGETTSLVRGDPNYPVLVTQVTRPNGQVLAASYNARGNLTASTDLSTGATTTYAYDNTSWPDFVTKATSPTGEFVEMDYDAMGNRDWQQDGRGTASRVDFRYYVSPSPHEGLLRAVQAPGNSAAESDSVAYDVGLGNLQTSISSRGSRVDYVTDGVGRVTSVQYDIDPPNAPVTENFFLDAMGRDTVTKWIGNTPGPNQETTTVRKFYDARGLVDSLHRSATPDVVGTLKKSWAYDRAGRVLAETDESGETETTVYDNAGNVLASYPRHLPSGDSIAFVYDELNRLVQRTIPSVHYDSIIRGLAAEASLPVPDSMNPPYPFYPNAANDGFDTPADSATFEYDAVGNITLAKNLYAEVTRTWNLDGTLDSETLKIGEVLDSTALSTHSYTTSYEYDDAGRVETITHPQNLAPDSTAYEVGYEYDDDIGLLSKVTDPEGNVYRYFYDFQNRPDSVALSGGISELFDYYPDGLLKRHRVHNSSTTAPRHPVTWLRNDSLTYDPRGKIVASIGTQGTEDQFSATYSGLGYLLESNLESDAIAITGNGRHYSRLEQFTYDGFGNLVTTKDSTADIGQSTTIGFHSRTYTYDTGGAGHGRLTQITRAFQTHSYEYDAAGNLTFTAGEPKQVSNGGDWDDRRSYYDALGRLVLAERGLLHFVSQANDWFRRIVEEFRYDALGRRVLVRSRQVCTNKPFGQDAECNVDWVRRTVWDRDRESWEIQYLDSDAYREWDTGFVQDTVDASVSRVDLNMLSGRVAYTYGLHGIDKPLAVHRINYSDNQHQKGHKEWAPFTNMPLWNFRGQVDNAVYADGARNHCDPSDDQWCVFQAWPAGFFGYWRQDLEWISWHGTLTRDKADQSGTHYRRNRYYDPNTGQFTQEDPIGLAGGLSLYGFANGDPVNLRDPFGLSADTVEVQTHEVALGQEHASIRITPDDQARWVSDPRFQNQDEQGRAYATIGAGPSGFLGSALRSDVNRSRDLGPHAPGVVVDPGSLGENALIERLFALDAAYCDCGQYAVSGVIGHNSNSYISGLLRAAGAAVAKPAVALPGWSNPLSRTWFVP